MKKRPGMRKGPPVIRAALLVAGLLASLTLVVWRQSRALEMERALATVRQERVVEEARRASLSRRVEALESRSRVSVAARQRLGMRVPTGAELVILPMNEATSATFAAAAGPPPGSTERGEG